MSPPIAPLPTLYELRIHAGYVRQRDIAAQLGVCETTYGYIERGRQNPNPSITRKLARLLRVKEALLWEVLR